MEKRQKKPWDEISDMLHAGVSPDVIEAALSSLDSAEVLHTVFSMAPEDQRSLLSLLSPLQAASLVEDLPDAHAADLIEEMSVEDVAPIVEELASDHRVDVLSELDKADAEAIISQLDEEDAHEVRQLIAYPPDLAGGLMMTEFASYPMASTVRQVVEDLTSGEREYSLLTVHYIYVVVKTRKLKGVIRIRDLVFSDPEEKIGALAIPALTVAPDTDLHSLQEFFDAHDIAAVPVVDDRGMLLGIVRRRAVLEALTEKSESDSLKAAGIIGGDELRSMPVFTRSRRRLAWLSINIGLNIIAASVIAAYEDTLTAVIALAVFLPIVSDMSGCSGNQAVAVSMRELTLGAAVPKDVLRVLRKEVVVGLINGVALGTLLGCAAWAWKGNAVLGLVVGGALAANTVVAVSIGGTVPLVLRRLKFDPAVASGPLLTTVTDVCGFFFLLSLASLVLPVLSLS
ncbi:MAG: magnesium transporter [Gammaproteobacteria bacterium]|nr:magnesium transporter [Gammaproteobacteria bacterium]MDH3373273.1 magnesium transporter [Gammaproteobacteria bacterium]MDH3409586.1 magnesium transporter [Gammaproteobacteria bacterium]MDH3551784.1 magnesium transporter [Gammaproteobacteria bacterium]